MYTMEDWKFDGRFSAEAGEEIEEAIYWEMFNCMPPLKLSNKHGFVAGFLMGEPHDCNENGLTYSAFGKRNGHYYFIGYVNR